ncbi:MAG: patatin-like phospholipase family protein, partial [Pseudomonadota bacterium]
FHIRSGNAADLARLTRVLRGAGVGLVLSGGGARAYAHIGIVEVLRAQGVPIDFIGGTSMGAIIAACVAKGWEDAEIEARVRAAFVESNPLNDYVLPTIGVVKGEKVKRLLTEHFGAEQTIEDLWLPYYCVSTNLTSGQPYRHWGGSLVDALRASIALPGILPPMVQPEGVLVDGGATNNLPVLAMRSLHRGSVVAVDVARETALHPGPFADELNQPWHRQVRRLPIASVLMRAATVASETGDRMEAKAADVVLTPQLGNIEIRSWGAYDEAVEAGRRHATEMLDQRTELAALASSRDSAPRPGDQQGENDASPTAAPPAAANDQVNRPPRTNEVNSAAPVTGNEQLVPTQT